MSIRSSTLAALAGLAFVALLADCARAQVGITIYRGGPTADGFDCTDPNNTPAHTMAVQDLLSVGLTSDTTGPAGLALAIGPAFPCPGIPVPGFGNELLLDPGFILPVGFSVNLVPRGSLAGWGYAPNNLTIPASAAGLTLTLQGIVPTLAGLPTFTRAIELTIT